MKRCYKKPWDIMKAYQFIIDQSEKAFDPHAVKAFKKIFSKIKSIYKSCKDL